MEAPPSPQAASLAATEGKRGLRDKSSMVVAIVAVVATSALACQLMGTDAFVHFIGMVCYGVVSLALGAFLVRPATPVPTTVRDAPAVSPAPPRTSTADAVDGAQVGDATSRGPAGASGGRDGGGDGNNGARPPPLPAPQQHQRLSAPATASPLNWVGETVEGSISWLRGSCSERTRAGRRRSRSTGGALLGTEGDNGGAISAATSPGASGGRASSNAAVSPTGFPLDFGRAAEVALGALPTLGAGIPQGQFGRSRVWSRTFGSGGVAAGGGGDSGGDDLDGDESVDTEPEREAAVGGGGGDWLVGAGMGDESESGSLSSAANGRPGSVVGRQQARAAAESDAGQGPAELNWEVDGRRQMLRRSSTNAGVPTEENQMVQDLLEMVSDAPVDHAGQWRPVRVRRGIHIWTSTVEGSPYCRIRGRMRCEATPAQLLQLLIDDERIGEYDRMFDRYELVARPNDHTSVRWTSYRAIWPTRPRDFVIRSTWEEFADGTIVIATRSVDHEGYPETPTFVRGKMVTCGYVICPLGESRRRRRNSKFIPPADTPADAAGSSTASPAAAAAAAGLRSPELRPSSEFTMYAHTDLGGILPASVINKLCKKPAYRVLRKIQDMIASGTLVKRGEAGEGSVTSGGAWAPPRPSSRMSRHDSEDVLGSLLAEGMPDRAAAANLEDVPEGEMEVASGAETEPMGRRRGSQSAAASDAGGAGGAVRRGSASQPGPSTPSPLLPGLSREFAISEAQRIMKTLNRMASDEGLGWSQLGVAAHSDMALYKSPVAGTKKVRLGASTCVSALSSELVGILLENAAMLGPDYIVDRQEMLETFSSGVSTGEGVTEAAARAEGEEPQHDTAVYWFSCTHKRQRICRDFVILRCFRPLPGCGGVIAYSSVDHPGLPPCPDYVRGKLDVSGFVIVPSAQEEEDDAPAPLSEPEHNRRSGPRRRKRQRWRGGNSSSTSTSIQSRRRARSSASGIGNYLDSEDEEDGGEAKVEPVGTNGRGSGSGGEGGGRSRRVGGIGRGGGVSEVTFFTHLTFSAYLPDFQEMEACRHFVGPLHILQELKWVVERTLGSSHEDEVTEAAANLLARGAGGGGADWGHASSRRRISMTAQEREEAADAADGETSAGEEAGTTGSGSMSDGDDSAQARDSRVSNAVLLRVSARREAALRDMLAFSSDGECMDGPQVDWRMIKDADGLKLWRAMVPGTVWCMIRTRAAVTAPPCDVMAYLLNDSCIPDYDELFDKIEVIESVDDSSVFKRTCYKPIWPTAPRDFSLLSSWGMLEDGTAYVVNRSVDHPMNPPVKGYVRGVVMLCGFLMVPRAPESGGGCTITMIVHTDLGGNLPATVLNRLSTSSPWRLVQRLRCAFQATGGRPCAAATAAAAAASSPASTAAGAAAAPRTAVSTAAAATGVAVNGGVASRL